MKRTLIPLITSAALVSCQSDEIETPAAGEENPAAPAAEEQAHDPKDKADYIGLTLEAAQERAEKASIPHRVIEVDGQSRPVTKDYRPERLNFSVKDGKVIQATNG